MSAKEPKHHSSLSNKFHSLVPKMSWAEYSPGFTRFKVSRYVSEFVGTMFLVASIKLIIGYNSINTVDQGILSLVAPFGIGLTLNCLICMFGYISLAQFNPAVTLGFIIRDTASLPRKDFIQWLMYWVSQFTGGIVGGFLAILMGGEQACQVYTSVPEDKNTYEAFFSEFFFTALLVSMNIHCASDSRLKNNQIYASAIGGTLTVSALAIGGVTGAALNPAVWCGTVASAASCVDDLNLKAAWIYWIAPLCAGVGSGLWFHFIYNWDGSADKFEESMLNSKEAMQLMKTITNDYKCVRNKSDDVNLNDSEVEEPGNPTTYKEVEMQQ
eukprot:220750_1